MSRVGDVVPDPLHGLTPNFDNFDVGPGTDTTTGRRFPMPPHVATSWPEGGIGGGSPEALALVDARRRANYGG